MKEKKAVQEAFTELSSHYEEAVDGELNLFWGWSYHKFLEELINQTTIQENQKILDIATGTLIIPRKILEQKVSGVQITGLDITESMLRQGKKKLKAESMDSAIDLTCADAMALPYSDESFDVVVSGLASHHMNIPLMLSEMKRVLKPEGLLSIVDVGTSPLWERDFSKELPGYLHSFTSLSRKIPPGPGLKLPPSAISGHPRAGRTTYLKRGLIP